MRYDISMEYFNGGGNGVAHLSWYSASQSKQIIPSNRLYPATVPAAPTAVISPAVAFAFLNQPFSFTVSGANLANAYTATGLPPGLTFNSSNGLISGTPTLAGDFQVTLTASNAVGLGAAVLDLQVIDTGSSVVREVWTGVPGHQCQRYPRRPRPPPQPHSWARSKASPITATTTASASAATSPRRSPAIITSGSPAATRRSSGFPMTANRSTRSGAPMFPPPIRTALAAMECRKTNQQSGWLVLVAGQNYYLEILHKVGAGGGTTDNWAVGWLQDPDRHQHTPQRRRARLCALPLLPAAARRSCPGPLCRQSAGSNPWHASDGTGSATLRVSADGSQAILKFSYSGLTSPITGEHIHCDPYLMSSEPDHVRHRCGDSAARRQLCLEHRAGIRHAAAGRHCRNHSTKARPTSTSTQSIIRRRNQRPFRLAADGSPKLFTPPPPPPAWTDDHSSANAAVPLPDPGDLRPEPGRRRRGAIARLRRLDQQPIQLPATHHLPVRARQSINPIPLPRSPVRSPSTPGGSNPSPRPTNCASASRSR